MFKPKGIMFPALLFILLSLSCSGPESDQPVLTAEMPLHLEDHLDDARIEGSDIPEDIPEAVQWDFNEPQPGWRPAKPIPAKWEAVKPVRVDGAVRIPLTVANRVPQMPFFLGAIYVELPDWNLEDWAYVEISARTEDPMRFVALNFNYTEKDSHNGTFPFYSQGNMSRLITDGAVHTYRLPLLNRGRDLEGPWTHLGIRFVSQPDEKAVTVDILSVKVVPKEHIYADAPVGVRVDKRMEAHRRTFYTHAPGRIEYCVRIPQAGRLDFGLGVLREEVPVTFRVVASQTSEQEVTLFEETYANPKEWRQCSVDLSDMAGKIVRIALEADAKQPGTVALWTAPTLTGSRATEKPNIIFYVIDGGGPDHMSVYGYNRRTTPNLERLVAEGALFENVYSNSTVTSASTPSFMTSLHSSVMGGFKDRSDPMLPEQAVTMAEHMHQTGYQTAVFTTNTFAGTVSGLERNVDVLRDADPEEAPSSVELHGDYWRWREAYPGEPYWVHFQTTDVHWPWNPPSPFGGLYVSPELRERYFEWERQIDEAREAGIQAPLEDSAFLEKTGIDPAALFHVERGFYDEGMAHQDYQLGRLVKRLKATGEWEHTLLIVAADHGTWAASLQLMSTSYDPMFRRHVTRVPLLIFYPGHIAGGQRFSQTVSMIDVLPTILDLVGLPMPEVMQGQSLVPLLLGEKGWEPRPVILDEFYVDRETSKLGGFAGDRSGYG